MSHLYFSEKSDYSEEKYVTMKFFASPFSTSVLLQLVFVSGVNQVE